MHPGGLGLSAGSKRPSSRPARFVAGGEGTTLKLAAGLWAAPFPDDLWLSPVSIGLGWKWPVTSRRESQISALLILEWSFGQ